VFSEENSGTATEGCFRRNIRHSQGACPFSRPSAVIATHRRNVRYGSAEVFHRQHNAAGAKPQMSH